ncbi:hypothetical protein, conserved [Trypanosoma vivax Y486]|uniref:RING-type domain-containing protein n=1 Tax=Trypanosoma vivax (strain Y486) TaxID=1055687 RepID=F9WQS4_TRYVY|nr:hypothetical protein, conserved [Trypanosoma vivax Y486]|eukprot:CCD19906.1 hypothetical protein, conserved [Trypanosoma vivax Y486]
MKNAELLINVFKSYQSYPRTAVSLLEEYHRSCRLQREMIREAEGHSGIMDSNGDGVTNGSRHNGQTQGAGPLDGEGQSLKRALQERRPVFKPPDRTCFDDGAVRVAPVYTDEIASVVLAQLERQTICVLVSCIPFRLVLSNPLPLPCSLTSWYTCDSCCCPHLCVGLQAVTPGGLRNTFSLYSGCSGYDVCLACAVYFAYTAFRSLQAALLPPLYRPLRLVDETSLIIHSAERSIFDSGNGEDWVHLRLRLAPINLRLCVWELSNPAAVADTVSHLHAVGDGRGSDGGVKCKAGITDDVGVGSHTQIPFAEEYASLPTPPESWIEYCTIAPLDVCRERSHPGEICTICQEPLWKASHRKVSSSDTTSCGRDGEKSTNTSPVVETTCHHLFHVDCLADLKQFSISVQECPLCRTQNFLEHVPKSYEYDVVVALRDRSYKVDGSSGSQGNGCGSGTGDADIAYIAVAGLVSKTYENPLSIAVCEVVRIAPGQVLVFEVG